jgi:hypothetical protein
LYLPPRMTPDRPPNATRAQKGLRGQTLHRSRAHRRVLHLHQTRPKTLLTDGEEEGTRTKVSRTTRDPTWPTRRVPQGALQTFHRRNL